MEQRDAPIMSLIDLILVPVFIIIILVLIIPFCIARLITENLRRKKKTKV